MLEVSAWCTWRPLTPAGDAGGFHNAWHPNRKTHPGGSDTRHHLPLWHTRATLGSPAGTICSVQFLPAEEFHYFLLSFSSVGSWTQLQRVICVLVNFRWAICAFHFIISLRRFPQKPAENRGRVLSELAQSVARDLMRFTRSLFFFFTKARPFSPLNPFPWRG